ncbi:unnamed protein product [Gadus morhua 'NCC']
MSRRAWWLCGTGTNGSGRPLSGAPLAPDPAPRNPRPAPVTTTVPREDTAWPGALTRGPSPGRVRSYAGSSCYES